MAQFLSIAWIDELNRAAAWCEPLAGAAAGVRLTLQQVVTRPGEPEAAYAVVVGDGRVQLVAGRAESPDVVLCEDYATATALSRGELSAQAALMAGRIRVRGNVAALVRGQQALAVAQACFDGVRPHTTY